MGSMRVGVPSEVGAKVVPGVGVRVVRRVRGGVFVRGALASCEAEGNHSEEEGARLHHVGW